jgi:hypothetical protein
MLRRLVPSVVLALACVALVGVAAPVASALTRDAKMKQNVRLLQVYIERAAAGKSFAYPAAAAVKQGGGLIAPVWPLNPWSGKPMAPGKARGSYTYALGAGGSSYALTGHLASGSYTVKGAAPAWLATERATAAASLTAAQTALTAAQGDLATARDEAARSGLGMIQEVVRNIAQGSGAPPTKATLSFAVLSASWPNWPLSAFDGQPMAQGTAPGQFTYTSGADGSWTLVAHLTSGDFTLAQGPYDWAAIRDLQTIEGVTFIGYGLELDAIMNLTYPATVTQAGLADTVDPWPRNPWTNASMADDSARGDYTYTPGGGGHAYDLIAHMADGSTYDVGAWTRPVFEPLMRLRVSLRDLAAQGYVQVLKDYIDEWKLDHSGALPTADEMSATGAVGTAHTWWPKSPWTLQPMAAGTNTGDFEYTPGAGGTFTLVLHQSPLLMWHGDPSTAFPATYTAQ